MGLNKFNLVYKLNNLSWIYNINSLIMFKIIYIYIYIYYKRDYFKNSVKINKILYFKINFCMTI